MIKRINKEDWMNSKWRPAMAWVYFVVCIADFVIFPLLWSLMQALHNGTVTLQWQPLTLQGAGLFHMAMGAIVGIAAYGRTQEKLKGVQNSTGDIFGPPTSSVPTETPFVGKLGPKISEPEQ